MKIQDLDKNFSQQKTQDEPVRFYEADEPPFDLYGVFYDGLSARFLRMPEKTAAAVGEGVRILNACTAGGRVRFFTDSRTFTLKAEWNVFGRMPHMPLSGSSGFVLLQKEERKEKFIVTLMPEWYDETGFERTIALPGRGMREYILYFPLYNEVSRLRLGFDPQATVAGGKSYAPLAPVVYYGSSITQGGCASRADNCYQALIAKELNVDFVNLGFSGNARAEEAMIEYLAALECSVMVFDYDHNAPTAEFLKATHRRMYELYRKYRPQTPVLFLSKPDVERDAEGKNRAEIVCCMYEWARRSGDERAYYIPGRELFGTENRENCTVDGTHPNDLGFYRMSRVIGKKLAEILSIKRERS